MGVTVVVGGQFGSEGKGKLVSYLSVERDADYVVRCGGPNAGHTIHYEGKKYVLRQVPAGLINPRTKLRIAAGAVVNPEILFSEMHEYGVDPERIKVDPAAAIISEREIQQEIDFQLGERVSSTLSGTGGATASKVLRDPELKRAEDIPELQAFISDVAIELNEAIDKGQSLIVEGTQGFGLSLHHGTYPFVTSRDTTAAAFISDAGLSPLVVDEIIMVIRTFPIRVAGHSGPLNEEISWDEVQKRSNSPLAISEYTTVSNRLRRVGSIDFELLRKAVSINRPTSLAIHGLDYISFKDKGLYSYDSLSLESKAFITSIENSVGTKVKFIYTDVDNGAIINI